MVQASVKERKIVLGWILDTRLFVIHLPEKKYLSWCEDIDTMNLQNILFPSLFTLEGRLNHAAYIIPTMRHYLSRLRAFCMIAEKFKKQPYSSRPLYKMTSPYVNNF
jgi:hypothetical protein